MLSTLLNDRYRLIRLLGSGGFGQTFLAEDTYAPDALQCVVKQFNPIRQDELFLDVARRLFSSEVKVLRKLGSHDRLPTLLDDFEVDGQFYLVQEFIDGRSLSHELQVCEKLDELQVVALLRDVAEILNFVHRENVIHRDIKPSNLIRRYQDGKLVLIDFGAVKELNTHILTSTDSAEFTVGIATQGYGPSEQLAGKPRFNSDLYALGMTAIQALTGLHPSQLPTDLTTGEVIWRDRANVSPWLADILTKLVRYHFNDRFQSAADLLAALEQTALVQPTDMQAKATWDDETLIPPADINSAHLVPLKPSPPPFSRLKPQAIAALVIGLSGIVTTGCVAVIQHIGWLEPLELAAFDRMVQLNTQTTPDPRILVVGITEADIQRHQRFPLSDKVIAQAIQRLQTDKPRAIGVDLIRDIPQEPGRSQLLKALQAPNTIAILNLGSPITPAPPGIPPQRVGFNDIPLDSDAIVRRSLLLADLPQYPDSFYALSLRLALLYLSEKQIKLRPTPDNANIAQLGHATLIPLHRESGGYQNLDDRGYQIMMQYQGKNRIQQVSLGDVLQGSVPADLVRDRVVLIGTTAPNAKDLFFTPYSSITHDTSRTSGVLIHAHLVSQLLSLALGEMTPLWYWTPAIELAWISGWAILAAGMSWHLANRLIVVVLINGVLVLGIAGSGYGIFLQSGWVPIAAPVVAVVIASSGVVFSWQALQSQVNRLPRSDHNVYG